ncbi:MAG TPA: hypothetical protein VFK13_13390 [Gemmatimonadaceae bacterium]|nr:hypothetical protein [Gemmatimonadaceae bacterium]
MPQHRPIGLTLLTAFFAFGALMAGITAVALLTPGGMLEPIWRLNPQARDALRSMSPWGIPLMVVVSTACAATALALWCGASWGRRLALVVLGVNLLGDVGNAVVRHDLRTLSGLPVGAALIAYLLRPSIRSRFQRTTKA